MLHCPVTSTELAGAVSLGSQCQEELPSGQVPQLEARPQRGSDHVRHAEDRQDGTLHDRVRSELKNTNCLIRGICVAGQIKSEVRTMQER